MVRVRDSIEITGTKVKIIAMISMLIDHFAVIILEGKLNTYDTAFGNYDADTSIYSFAGGDERSILILAIFILRVIGRMAFPLYTFLLVEGFIHTRSVGKYALNMLIFAIISQLPYNLMDGSLLHCENLNVLFTHLLGIICMLCIRQFGEKRQWSNNRHLSIVIRVLLCALSVLICALASEYLNMEYGAYGLVAIVIIYLFRQNRSWGYTLGVVVLTLSSLIEVAALAMIPIIRLYNGKRGMRVNKYVFYAFYPIHIMVLYLIALALGYTTFTIW